METLLREFRLAGRSLRRDPVFSLAAVLTLALGLGATTAVFSILHGVLLAPLPFPESERIVRLYSMNVRQDVLRGPMSPSDMWDMKTEARSLVAASPVLQWEGTIENDVGEPVRIPAYVVSGDFFDVFGMPMALGRGYLPEEDEPGTTMEVVLSHRLWRTAFGGDPGIVGANVTLEGSSGAVVVGVAPPAFRYPRDAALWVLPGFNWANMARRGRSWDVVARMAPGTSVATAQTELSMIATRLEQEHPQWNSGVGIVAVPLKESIVGDLRTALVILMAASAGLLAVAAANVANLMVARGAARMSETALRAALGASGWRIAGTLFAEAFVVSVAGALSGVLLALGSIRLFKHMAPPSVSLLGDVTFGWQALAFAGAITLAVTLIFGLIPALRAASVDLRGLLGEGGRGASSGAGGSRLRAALVVAEVGVATALVIGSGLLLKSFQNLSRVDPGFSVGEAMTFNLLPPVGLYNLREANQYYDRVLPELASMPGVGALTAMTTIPLGTEYDPYRPLRVLDLPEPEPGDQPQAYMRVVDPGFFEVMGVPVLEGRALNAQDVEGSVPVALVNRAFVRQYLGDGRALDRQVHLESTNFAPVGRAWVPDVRIVGVVGDVHYEGLGAEPRPAIYLPRHQAPFRRMTVLLVPTGDAASLAAGLRQRLDGVDPRITPSGMRTLDEVVRASTVSQRFVATLLLVFGAVALLMALVGIYGVVSYQVTERVREMAVRMAMGATPGQVVLLILKAGALVWGLGIVAGMGGAILLREVVSSQLYGISATDPAVFVGVALVLGSVSLAASSVPALRTTRLQPGVILRQA